MLRDQVSSTSNVLVELLMQVGQHLPDQAHSYDQRARLIEQWRDLTAQALNRAVDHELGG